jgi:SRSO17 transposase
VTLHARHYLSGLLQATRRNVQRIAEAVPGTDAQALHHFLAHSPWDARAVMDQVAREVGALLGGDQDSCLLLDETCFAKKGKQSVGVARQWFGLQGKTDNCQVAVFAALAHGKSVSLIDTELYLPREWIEDSARCEIAGVPAERQVLKTKPSLALEMVSRARRNGVRFSWVAADGTYGQDRALLRALDDAGETFVVDVHRDQRVFLENPRRRGAKKRRTAERAQAQDWRVDEWVTQQPAGAWQEVWIRHSSQGELRVQALRCQVWILEAQQSEARCWQLVVTREIGSPDTIKYSLSNAAPKLSLQRLAYMQRQRYWVERAFQEAKNEAGMDEYQARSWQAWNHHMALVMMALLFLLREKHLQKEELPLLSAADVKILLARLLPRRDLDPEETIKQIQLRHRQRQAAIDSAYRRQKNRGSTTPVNLTK